MTVHATSLQRQLHAAHIERQRKFRLLKTQAEKQAEIEAEMKAKREAAYEAWRNKVAWESAKRKEHWRASWRKMVFLAERKQRKELRRKELAAMGDSLPAAMPFATTLEFIAAKYDVTVADIKSRKRSPMILVQARLEAYWVGRQRGYSLKMIARMMGGRDHTTILAGERAYEKLRIAARTGTNPYKARYGLRKFRPDLIITDGADGE